MKRRRGDGDEKLRVLFEVFEVFEGENDCFLKVFDVFEGFFLFFLRFLRRKMFVFWCLNDFLRCLKGTRLFFLGLTDL